jgi:NhaP-type Na+/H+ or K+/H+ antiporter
MVTNNIDVSDGLVMAFVVLLSLIIWIWIWIDNSQISQSQIRDWPPLMRQRVNGERVRSA